MRLYNDSAPAREEPSADRPRRITTLAEELTREVVAWPQSTHSEIAGHAPKLSQSEQDAQAALEVAGFVDDVLQTIGDDRPYSTVLADFLASLPEDPTRRMPARALDRLYRRFSPAASKLPPRLGVCPAVVFKALALLRSEHTTYAQIEKIAECDPILATSLLSHANSLLYARSMPVCSVGAAVAYIGLEAAKKVIVAASARPLFGAVSIPELWAHSVDVAAIAEQLAATTKMVDPSDAFVAGLIHDIGRLALEMTSDDEFLTVHHRLARATRCALLADIVLTGHDHGHFGATVLDAWRLPEQLTNAIRYHHRPELSTAVMPSILYLAETISHSDESIPVSSRLEWAMRTAGVTTLDCVSSDLRRLGTALAMVG
jgi:putative nucleotidyltransferase with HDIG domain